MKLRTPDFVLSSKFYGEVDMYTVYILENLQGFFYTGFTSKEITERVLEHNQGKCRWTKNKRPWIVRYVERWTSKAEAYRREKQIKSYKSGRAFKELITSSRISGGIA